MLATLALAALAAQTPPLSASVANVTVIGLSEEQESDTKAKIDEELAALGATVFPGPVVEADCVPDPACLRAAMKDAGAEVWVYLEAIRVGPAVQVSSTPINKYELLGLLRDAYGTTVDIVADDRVAIDRSLDSTRFRALTGFEPPTWGDMISEMAADPTPYEGWRPAAPGAPVGT